VFEEQGERYYHPFHVAPVRGTTFVDVQSAYGYGGPVATCDDSRFLRRATQAYRHWAIHGRVLAEFIRFHPLLENWRYYDGEVLDDRETVWMNLSGVDPAGEIKPRVWKNIKRAKGRGVQVEWLSAAAALPVFVPLYNSLLQAKEADDSYRFPGAYYEGLANSGLLECCVCVQEQTVVAAALFLRAGESLEYHLAASSETGQALGAMSLALWEAALRGQQLGCRRLHLGGGTDHRPDNSLLYFKRGFSNQSARFRIGKDVHHRADYAALRIATDNAGSARAGRVLFYR
jgi:hypothetical protein